MPQILTPQIVTIYHTLAELRENFIAIKESVKILEKVNRRQLQHIHEFSNHYIKTTPNQKILEIPRFIIPIILLPEFFNKMLRDLSTISDKFKPETYVEITYTINDMNWISKTFTTMYLKDTQIKKVLDSHIWTFERELIKLL